MVVAPYLEKTNCRLCVLLEQTSTIATIVMVAMILRNIWLTIVKIKMFNTLTYHSEGPIITWKKHWGLFFYKHCDL
jgi:hypothetical protein